MGTRRSFTARLGFGAQLGATLCLVASLIGCELLRPSPNSQALTLGVANGTSLDVAVLVNGRLFATYPAGGPLPTVDQASLPALPWVVEAWSPTGRLLLSVHVNREGITPTTAIGFESQVIVVHSGVIGILDLSCGRLLVWIGESPPGGPPPPASPGHSGDCQP
jgi:hypothetical protein